MVLGEGVEGLATEVGDVEVRDFGVLAVNLSVQGNSVVRAALKGELCMIEYVFSDGESTLVASLHTHKNESKAQKMTRTSSGSSILSSTPPQALSSGTISMWWPSSDPAMA